MTSLSPRRPAAAVALALALLAPAAAAPALSSPPPAAGARAAGPMDSVVVDQYAKYQRAEAQVVRVGARRDKQCARAEEAGATAAVRERAAAACARLTTYLTKVEGRRDKARGLFEHVNAQYPGTDLSGPLAVGDQVWVRADNKPVAIDVLKNDLNLSRHVTIGVQPYRPVQRGIHLWTSSDGRTVMVRVEARVAARGAVADNAGQYWVEDRQGRTSNRAHVSLVVLPAE